MRLATFSVITALIAVPALAQDKLQASNIKARQGYFTMLGANMAPLAGMAKGEIEYDEAAAAQAAANIEALSNYMVSMHFVEGTSADDVEGSSAKADIWADMDGFKAKYVAFADAAAGASEAVKGGQGNVGPVLGKIGATCKGCHDSYKK